MRLREANHLQQRATIENTLSEAATALPTIAAARGASTPDDSGAGGYFVEDDDGIVSYQKWFRVGHAVGTRRLRPY